MTDERAGTRKALAHLIAQHAELRKSADAAKQLVDAQMKEAREDCDGKLDIHHNLFKARDSELLQERDKSLAEQEQPRTDRDEITSRYHEVL